MRFTNDICLAFRGGKEQAAPPLVTEGATCVNLQVPLHHISAAVLASMIEAVNSHPYEECHTSSVRITERIYDGTGDVGVSAKAPSLDALNARLLEVLCRERYMEMQKGEQIGYSPLHDPLTNDEFFECFIIITVRLIED